MMANPKHLFGSICLTWCCMFYVVSSLNAGEPGCDLSKCPGPLAYYKDLGCTPLYTKDVCCPHAYKCDNLRSRDPKKCYFKGKAYAVGEKLKAADAGACNAECKCGETHSGVAQFVCPIIDCFARADPGCYLAYSRENCCPSSKQICPDKDKNVFKCDVDGSTYYTGQYFNPKSNPSLKCLCAEGYKGQNVEPFCKSEETSCGLELRHAFELSNNCPPVYYSYQNPATECNIAHRCQNGKDEILPPDADNKRLFAADTNSSPTCKYGNLTLKRGEELNMATDYSSVCVKCVCNVPPVLTCQRLPDDVCDVTKHPKFDDF